MRIGIDASRAFVGERTGTEEYSYQLISHLMQLPEVSAHEFVLYVREISNSKFQIPNNFQIPNIKFQIIYLPFLWTQVGLAYRTWVDKLDVLWIPAHTLPVLRKPGIKTVVTIHGIEYEWLPQYENWLQRWYLPLSTQYAVKSANKIIAVSEFTKKQLVERLHAKPEKIEVVHEGTSPLSFPSPTVGEGVGGEVLNKYNLQTKKYILFIGTVQPRKNLVRLVKAFSQLNPKRYTLVIVGKLGWSYQEVLDEISNSSVKDQIVILGYINNIERDIILHNALVYVQPSITEGFGLPVLEAFAAGVPVVSSNGGALQEILQIPNPKSQIPSYAGLLFNPYDQLDILDKLAKAISNHKLRKKLITRGHLRIREFSWKKAAIKTYNILTNTHSK